MRVVATIGAALLLAAMTAGCGGTAPAANKASGQASSERPAQKAAASPEAPSTPKPSPTPDPAGRTEPVDGTCPDSHQLKGATSPTGERLYYEPDRASYPSITPEICFTAGGDARANGYTESRR